MTGAKLEHLGQTLADLPTVRARIGRSQTEVDALAGFLSDLARRMGEGDAAAPVLSAKAVGERDGDQGDRRCDAGLRRCCVEPGAADASARSATRAPGSVMAPTTDVLYELVGRALAGMPLM